jgi:hypothetical protein
MDAHLPTSMSPCFVFRIRAHLCFCSGSTPCIFISVNGTAVEDVPICFDDNYSQPLVDRVTARGIPPEGGGGEYRDSRVEQDMKVEVVTSVDDHLGREELVFPPATTTLQQVAAACTLLVVDGQRRIRSRSLAGNALKVMCKPIYLQLFGEISKRSAGRSSCRTLEALRNFFRFHTQTVDRMHHSHIWPVTPLKCGE